MFGFQRIGDLIWAGGDSRARGFLIGATSGRTTLNGEGLQHEDGHSHLMANTVPNCLSYDPTFSYELAVIIQEGLRRMVEQKESVFYYITTMNENYEHPDMIEGSEAGILKGMYCFKKTAAKNTSHVQLLGSGSILREVIFAADLLEKEFQVTSDIWSVTSFNLLARNGQEVERWNRHHPMDAKRIPYITSCLEHTEGPIIASTDYIKLFSDQVRAYVPRHYVVLGTDGFGRSDTRSQLRQFFEVDRYYVACAALKALADEGVIPREVVQQAMEKYKINPEKPNPITV